MKSAILACLCLVTIVFADVTLDPVSGIAYGLAGNGTIFYQSVDAFSFGGLNIQNPVEVSISYQQNVFNFEASICYNYNGLPINGASLESSCPSGGYGTASNTTSYLVAPNNQVQKTQYSSLKSRFIGNKMALATTLPEGTTTETTTAKVFIKPQSSGKFVVTVPDSVDPVHFYVGYSTFTCSDKTYFPINGSCVQIPVASAASTPYTIGSNQWQYLQFPVNVYKTNITSFNVTLTGAKDNIKLYVQSGYYPALDWFINTIDSDDDDVLVSVVANPASTYIDSTETFFFGIYNSDKNSQTVSLNVTFDTSCNAATNFGYRCSHALGNATSPVSGFNVLSATLKQGSAGVNNTYSYDFTDKDKYSDYDYAYFILNDYPTPDTPGYESLTYPYYIRVTVANNDVSEYAPAFYAKYGGFPSAQSATYNVSTATDVSHQIIIEVNQHTPQPGNSPDANTWVFAVQLKADFSIWVGINCANDCDNDDHGSCMCNDISCSDATANNTNLTPYYTLPTSTVDSAGSCTCDDDDYDYSYDCSQKNNGNAALYIVLIAVGGMIVLAVAIGVPIYCYISNKKATRYDRM